MAQLPALGVSQRLVVAAPPPSTPAGSPLRVTVHYRPPLPAAITGRRRYSRTYTDAMVLNGDAKGGDAKPPAPQQKAVRRVRFDLPPATTAASTSPAATKPVQVAGVQSWLRSRAAVAAANTAVGASCCHETARYRRGTLPPPTPRQPAAQQLLLRVAREADEDVFGEMDLDGADLNCVDASGRTALSHIAAHGSLPMLEALLQHPEVDVNKADSEGNTPLHYAAQAGHVEVLNYLLSRRPDVEVDARNALGFTPLMKAALQGRTKCAKLLLFAGASPTLRDYGRGLRAEQWARFCGRYVCAEVIEKFARHRLLERTTAYGRWGSEPELGQRLLLGARASAPEPSTQRASPPTGGLKSKLRKAFRTNSSGASAPPPVSQYSLVTQLTTAALCASSPVLPAAPHVPPVVKSLIRPLTVPKVQVTLAGGDGTPETECEESPQTSQQQQKPPTSRSPTVTARSKKKK